MSLARARYVPIGVTRGDCLGSFRQCGGRRDDGRVDYEVSLADAESRRTAVVAAATTWQEFPGLWGQFLGEVWDCLHAGGIYRGCRNIMLYWDSVPTVEVGVLLDQPCPLTGRVVASALPVGTAAMTVHRGPSGTWGRPMTPLWAGAPRTGIG